MPPGAHAVLSASSAHMWLTCTPSARLSERMRQRYGEQETTYAREGTKAHALGELKIRRAIWRADKMTAAKHGAMSPSERAVYQGINTHRYNALREELVASMGEIPDDMEQATDTYCDVVMEHLEAHTGGRLFLEQRVDYSQWAPDGFGTSDCIIVSDDLLEVIDYKNGTGVPVSAEGNPQLRLYTLGAYVKFSSLYDFQLVRYTIVQPHLSSITSEGLSVPDLLTWATDTVTPAAKLAHEGKGDFAPGEACRFCGAKAVCAARAAEALKIFDYGLAGSGELSEQQLTEILPRLDSVEEWIKDLRAYTEDRALHGQRIRGFKLVRGKRPNRAWADDEEVRAQLLRNGYGPEQYEETKLKSVGQIEKTIGAKAFRALLSGLVRQGEGRLMLVPESDPRPEYNSADAAFGDMVQSEEATPDIGD